MLLHKAKTYAVITGASSGLGREFSIRLAKRGYRCLLVARREDRLKELCDELNADEHVDSEVSYLCADLSSDAGLKSLCSAIDGKRIEVFINNAGFGDTSEFLEGSLEKELQMINVNITALHYLTKKVLKIFDRQGYGFLLNVASSAGLFPGGPYMATYYATKAYVVSLTRGIASELKDTSSSVYVGCLCPGPVDTEFNSVANAEFSLPGISAAECVDYALKKMYAKKTVIVPSFKMRAAVAASRLCPPALAVRLAGRQQQKKIYG